MLKQRLKAPEILTLICHLKVREQGLIRYFAEQASKHEAIWALNVVLDFLTPEETDLVQVQNTQAIDLISRNQAESYIN